jgi:hypothetical protein
MKVLDKFEGVLDVICIEENKIPCRTKSAANAVRSTAKVFSGQCGK